MDQQHQLSKQQREQKASEELAERLEALTTPMADRILGRAVALDAAARDEAEKAASTIDYETLRDIALEVGISEKALKKAILEEFDTEKDRNPTPLERATVPDSVRGGLLLDSSLEQILGKVQDALGLTGLETTRGPDGAVLVQLRDAAKRLGMPRQNVAVRTWSVPQGARNRHLVEVDVNTKDQRNRAWRWIIGALILFSLLASNLGGLIFMGIWIAGIASAFGWMKRIRRRAGRFINGMLNDLMDGDPSTNPQWLDLWERSKD